MPDTELTPVEVIVGNPVTRRMIESAPRLRLVHAAGAGCDAIDMAALPPQVPLCNVFHHERAIAEYVIMTVLAMERNLICIDRDLRLGIWDSSCVTGPPLTRELAGRKLGILGFGHIGREVARLARAFDMEIDSLASRHTPAELKSLLAGSDYLVIACPLNEQTAGLIGSAELSLMKPTAALIQVARGEILDEKALYEALRDRTIRAAAIDVWYQYPSEGKPCLPSRYAFQDLDNVIMTPHCSGWTERVLERRFRDIAANIERLARGEPLQNLVRREAVQAS
jgi:phosphoglycerate dehydrogenase-like enzyme